MKVAFPGKSSAYAPGAERDEQGAVEHARRVLNGNIDYLKADAEATRRRQISRMFELHQSALVAILPEFKELSADIIDSCCAAAVKGDRAA